MKKVVVIGGGTGVYTALSGLKKYNYNLSVIVSMSDNGGSTGLLREEFGVLPPGDIRRALIALSDSNNKILSDLFNFRFEENSSFKGHSLGNLLLTALEKITGNFDKAVKEAVKILNVKGDVIPVTLTPTLLCAELENGEIIKGETNIDIPKHDGTLKVKKVFLEPSAKANKRATTAIKQADIIILGPGDLYTSILPNLIVEGIKDAVIKSKAKKIYIVNIMTKYGETYKFSASDFFQVIEDHLGKNIINCCVINKERGRQELLEKYKEERDEFVIFDNKGFKDKKVNLVVKNLLRRGQFLRHDSVKLAQTLAEING